jgi:hypothetical protein
MERREDEYACKRERVSDTRDGPAIADDRCDDRMVVVETLARLEVGRVQILRTMRKEVETCPTFLALSASTGVCYTYAPAMSSMAYTHSPQCVLSIIRT